MEIINYILLGIVQGITEFLPISSTAHLILVEKLLKIRTSGLTVDVALHFGTLIALLFYFRRKYLKLIRDLLKGEIKLFSLIVIATLPALIIAFLFEKTISTTLRSVNLLAVNLIIFGVLLYMFELISKKSKNIEKINFFDSMIIGIFQAIAVIPGVSRSGITVTGGLLRNFTKESAAEFAFLISAPIIFLASAKDGYDILNNSVNLNIFPLIIGALFSAIVGYFSIIAFLNYLKKNSFLPFVIYRIVLGSLLLIVK